jgi:hypothetical protein
MKPIEPRKTESLDCAGLVWNTQSWYCRERFRIAAHRWKLLTGARSGGCTSQRHEPT